MSSKQPKKKRLLLNDGSCVRLRPSYPNHVWSYDFVEGYTHDGRKFRTLNVIDEFTRYCLVIRVERRLNSRNVVDVLFGAWASCAHKIGQWGPEFIAKALRGWLEKLGVNTAYIEPGSPWENGYCESFNSKFRDELLNMEIFTTLREAQILIERWRDYYNKIRPHSSLGYRPQHQKQSCHGP